MATVSGGDKLRKKIETIVAGVKSASAVKSGFLAGATYPNGTPVAMIAFIQDRGSRTIPPRPFFRDMIDKYSETWAPTVAAALKASDYDAAKALGQLGELMDGQIRQSIQDTNAPPLAKSTIRRKGFDKPLIDKGHMWNSVDHKVVA